MKIVFVVPVLAPYAVSRFKELAKIGGVDLHVIVEKAKSSDRIGWKYENIDGVKTYLIKRMCTHRFVRTNPNGNYSQSEEHIFSFDLKRIIKNIMPNIVIVCNSSQLLMLLGVKRYKLGVIVEDTLRADDGRNLISKLIKKVLLKTANFYCAFSNDSIDFLHKYGVRKHIIKTSWSIDNNEFVNMTLKDINTFKAKKNISNNKTSFIIVANLLKRKGILEFLNSWKQLPDNVSNNVELYIAGDGPEKNRIIDFIHKNQLHNVKLLGHIEYSEVKKYLQSIDVFVLPTLEDLNSLSVYEALAARRPLLVSKFNGSRFLVKENLNGFVFDPYNADDTQNKIIKLFNSDLKLFSNFSRVISEQYTNKLVMHKFYTDLCHIS